MSDVVLGLRLLARSLRAGELTLLVISLALAVAAMATVSLFTERARLALEREANRLLGADLVFSSARPIDRQLGDEAARRGLPAITTLSFRSMVIRGEINLLAEITAVDPGYPLRGTTRIARDRTSADQVPGTIPGAGTIWGDERLFAQLGLKTNDAVRIGERTFTLAALLTQDPSLTLSVLGMGPRIIMPRSDVESTGLISAGSRVVHRLLVAGERVDIDAFRTWAASRIEQGVRLEGVRDARPEVRSALERAERFMNLAALAAVALAAVAVILATRRYFLRELDVCAMMRCLGVGQQRVFMLNAVQLLGAGVIAATAGCVIGYLGQVILGHWLTAAIGIELPQPGFAAALRACAIGLVLLLAFGLPPLVGLRKVPALRVLRRDTAAPDGGGIFAYVLGIACVAGLVLWHASDLKLGSYVLLGSAATIGIGALATWIALRAATYLGQSAGVSFRYGVANLRRRMASTIWQVIALSLGLTALLTLSLVRNDLLQAWQASLPADAPNRFLVNIQPDQVRAIEALLTERMGRSPDFYPMVRGRLIAVNDLPIDPSALRDDRARRLVEREFNISFSERLPRHNRITAGDWHRERGERAALSVEEGLARTLGLKLGDRLTYDVAGEQFSAPITSLRKVEWDSFRVNFFVIGPPSLLSQYPATYITSFHLPSTASDVLSAMLAEHSNVVVIDIGALLTQVQTMIEQVSRAVTFVFVFTLAAGLLVLYTGIVSTHDERAREVAIMRTLGANRKQVLRAHLAEFATIGAFAGLFAAAGASGLGYFVATNVLLLPYRIDPNIWPIGIAAGTLGVAAAGMLFTRRVLATAPLVSLRQLA
jgi:putative ABC transport system permease protein